MVIAHAATMNGVDGWGYAAEENDTGAILTVIPPNTRGKAELKGLGFFGILTKGIHHQEHHLMIAKGMNPHE